MSANPIAGRTIWFLVSNVSSAGISFLTMILLAWVLSPVEFGVLALFLTFNAVLTSLMSLSLDGSVSVTYFKRSEEELRVHVSSCIVLIAIIFMVLTSLVLVFSAPLASWLHLSIKWLVLGLVCAAGQAIANIKLALWMVKGDAKRYAIFQIVQSLMLASLTAGIITFVENGWESRGWALVFIAFLFGSGSVLIMIGDGECSLKVSISEMRLALRFGVPLIPHVCGALLFNTADRFVVNSILGVAATGIYQFVAQVGSVVMILTDALNKVISPWLHQNLTNAKIENKIKIIKMTYMYFVLAAIVSFIGFLLPWNLAVAIGGNRYAEGGILIPFFVLAHCIGGMYFMVVNYIFYSGKTGLLSVGTLVSGSIGLIFCYFLVQEFGLIGAGLSLVISKSLHFLITWYISNLLIPMPWSLGVLKGRADNESY